MGKRLSKIYTRTGDDGSTGLGINERVAKDCPRIEAIGAVDELNSHIGVLLSEALPEPTAAVLEEIQHRLFDLGGELSMPGFEIIQDSHVMWLERVLDALNKDLPALQDFILPAGGRAPALCHVARTVCRRAERRVVSLSHHEAVSQAGAKYLNRLSDLLFVMARVLARHCNGAEVLWQKQKPVPEI